ncbi:MAG TPA: LysR family transcriptional regulator [Steroidobacter sp.]
MSKIDQMVSFVAVVEAGSFVAAAEATGQSKAAVSRHVAELEQRLGVRLLQRTTRRLSLTEEGHAFFARAREILDSIDEAEAELTSRSHEPTGLLRVNAPLTFGVLHLAPLWGRFVAAHPKISLDVTLGDRQVDLIEEGYDLAIRIASDPSPQLVSRKLATTRVVLCASPAYLSRHGVPKHPSELAHHAAIAYTYWSGGDEWRFDGPDGPVVVKPTWRLRTNNGDTCRRAALDGYGVILQPDFLIGEDLKRGDLVELLPEYRSIVLTVHAIYPTRKHLPLKVRCLVDFLVDAFKAPSWRA